MDDRKKKELRMEITFLSSGSQADEAAISDLTNRLMEIRRDYSGKATYFNLTEEDAPNENTRLEIICPLCKGTVPQLIYRQAEAGGAVEGGGI